MSERKMFRHIKEIRFKPKAILLELEPNKWYKVIGVTNRDKLIMVPVRQKR